MSKHDSWKVQDYLVFRAGRGFEKNMETVESGYLGLEELPRLAEEKNNREQIEMCFQAYRSDNWKTVMD